MIFAYRMASQRAGIVNMSIEPIKYIKKVEIQGLWGRYDIEWNLNSDVNVLAGINGSGKSTILDCISGLITMGKIHSSYLGNVKKVKLFFDNNRCLPYQFLKIEDTVKNIEKMAHDNPYIKEIIDDLKEVEGDNYKKIKSIGFERHLTLFEDLQMTLDELRSVVNVDIISTFDNSLKQAEAIKKLSDDEVETELDWEIYQLQKEYLEYQLNVSKRKDSIIEENSEDIKEKLVKIKFPQVRFLEIMDKLFSETLKKINRVENQVEFLIGDKKISPFKLSSGEKQLLIILLTVLIQDNKPTILFMDEPEISLHIEWQRKLIGYIRELNPNVQVIIATHSPDIIMEGWMDKVFNASDIIVKDNATS